MRTLLGALGLALPLAAASCDDHQQFTTGPGESYCGAVTVGAVFRAGLSPRVQMRLKLDADKLDDSTDSPGALSTFEAADPATSTAERRMLSEALLRPIPAMQHDPLSRPAFGDGRERNAIYAVSPVDPEAESLLAIVSLRSDDAVEVRLIRPGSPTNGNDDSVPDGRRQIFGVFSLERKSGECGF